jgi:hypothetical protein
MCSWGLPALRTPVADQMGIRVLRPMQLHPQYQTQASEKTATYTVPKLNIGNGSSTIV